jgi:hypothetical protein
MQHPDPDKHQKLTQLSGGKYIWLGDSQFSEEDEQIENECSYEEYLKHIRCTAETDPFRNKDPSK